MRLQKRSLRIGWDRLGGMNRLVEFLGQIARALFLKKGIRGSSNDPKEPCACVPFRIAAKETYGTETRLLCDVFSVVGIPNQPARQVVGRIEIWHYHLLEARPTGYPVRFLLHAAIRLSRFQTGYRASLSPCKSHRRHSGVYQTM